MFNAGKFIHECLNSVSLLVTNNRFSFEHILVDDCSTDDSWKIIQKCRFPHLRSFRLKENAGSSNARNFAVKKTDAHYLFFLDQDDVIFQNSLQLLCEHTNAGNPEWLYGDFLRTDKNLAYQLGQDYYGFQFKNSKDLLCSIFSGQHFFQQNCLYRRHSFESVGGFDMRIAIYQDLDLCIRFALTGHVPLYVPGPLYAHRFHENNLSKLYGRENNPRAHKEDLKSLYETYGISLRSMLTSRQVRKIEDFLTET